MPQRFTSRANASAQILGDKLTFPNGRFAHNRFLKTALSEIMSVFDSEDAKKHGLPTTPILNIYDKWGNGGFGMVMTSNVLVDPKNLEAAGNAIIFKEGDSPERRALFTQWAKNMKQDGALAIVQLSHAGRQTPEDVNPSPWSASDVKCEATPRLVTYGQPKEIPAEQIEELVIDKFVYAAKFAFECGFDGVEIHAAHGFLLSQFTSPTTNKRKDLYGGSLENRQRIILEIFEAIRNDIPASTGFIVGVKTNSVEFQAEGTTLEDAKKMCQVYEEKGFDFVELSGGNYEKFGLVHEKESTWKREAFFIEFAEQIRPVFKNTVVYLTGGFRTVEAMVDAIQKNATQGIGMGRPTTAEPDLPKKILEGRVFSAIKDLIDPNETGRTSVACSAQLLQMSKTSMKEAGGDVMHKISDFSDPETFVRFESAMYAFFQESARNVSEGRRPAAHLVFE